MLIYVNKNIFNNSQEQDWKRNATVKYMAIIEKIKDKAIRFVTKYPIL